MKTKFNGILTLLLAFMVQFTFAQEKTISGVVSDDMGPVSDITVKVKGTDSGTVTDFDGNYTIKAKTGDVIEFTHISYGSIQKVVGASNTIDVLMSSTGVGLDEVIVNALGVKKKKSNDLSSSTKIDITSIEKSGESGLLQGMAGKTSGVNIIKSSGDPGSGSFIQIRGANTLSNTDQPLVVLDGVLISNDNFQGGTDGVASQSRLNDIPASDIEDVTILKGAQAAALYGSAAAAGVIVITTKKGRVGQGKNWKVTVNSSIQIETVKAEWDLNTTFGQGVNGGFIQGFALSFGDKISSRSGQLDDFDTTGEYFEAENGTLYYPIVNKNDTSNFNSSNRDAVLGQGFTSNYDVSLQYGGENGNTYISFSKWDQDGIIKNSSNYVRNTFRINNTTNYSDKLTGKISASYINSDSDLIQQGSNIQGLYLGYLRNPADFDFRDYKGTYYAADGTPLQNAHRAFRNPLGSNAGFYYNNPLWTVNEQDNNRTLDRFLISPELSYKINDKLSFITRYNVDIYHTGIHQFFPFNTAGDQATGSFLKSRSKNNSQYFIAMLLGNEKISNDIEMSWSLGGNYENVQFESIGGLSSTFTNPFITLDDVQTINGSFSVQADQQTRNYIQKTAKSGGFAAVDFNIYDQLLLGFTGRLEKTSTLIDELTFFPSASLGWKFSKLIGDNDFFNFGKLRLTYGEVATGPVPYNDNTPFVANVISSGYGDQLLGSQYGGLFNSSSSLGNPDLKIERVKEYEIGADFRLYKNLIDFGITYYDRVTEDALVRQQLAPSSGYNTKLTNNAEITNKGLEVDLGIKLLNTEDFKWKINLNYSKNENLVSIPGGDVFLNGFTGTSAVATDGEALSALKGGAFLRDVAGSLVLDGNGFPQLDTTGDKIIGDPNADWRGGVNTQFNWKGFSVSATLETSQGNDVWNGTKGVLQFFGRHADTANEVTVSAADAATILNYSGTAIDALSYATQNSDGSYTVRGNLEDFGNGTVLLDQDWYTDLGGGFGPVAEQFIEDGSWIKLREVSLGYNFKPNLLKKIGITNIDFTLSGRNLVTWTDVEGFDPEGNLTGASKGRGLEYFTNPATKSYNFSLKIGF